MANIAVNIKKLRLQKGITQETFAKTVNVSRQAISSWETGRTQPDIEMIGTLADALGVSIEELIYGEKRNIKIDNTEKNYVSTATIVLSILGGFMLLAGAILILVWSWEHIPVVAKTLFALVPMALGAGFAVYTLNKMKNDSFMTEIGAVSWAAGNIISLIFINELFEHNLTGIHIALISLALTLPVMLIMKSVSSLTVFYGAMAYAMSDFWYFSSVRESVAISVLSIALIAGILFVHLYRNKIDYARHRYAQLITILSALYYIYEVICDYCCANPYVALLIASAICYLYEKENDLTSPLYLFGTAGSMLFLHDCLLSGSDFLCGYTKSEITFISTALAAFVMAVLKNKASLKENTFKRLHIIIIAAGALLSIIHSVIWIIAQEEGPLTIKFSSFAVFAFAACIFALAVVYLMQGLKENRLYPLNLGFVSIAALAIILLTAFETDMLVKGCVLLLMGGILMFMNLKITRKKEKVKKAEATAADISETGNNTD